jgi:predicted lipoprotein with Yx(FWY)xxD motif
MEKMSQQEEQGGWRSLACWGLGIGIVFAIAVVSAAYFAKQHKARMEGTDSPALIDGLGLGAIGPAVLHSRQSPVYGEYLVDNAGRPLYLFKKNEHESFAPDQIECKDTCATAWPPLMTSSAPSAVPPVNGTLLATIERPEGSSQETLQWLAALSLCQGCWARECDGPGCRGFRRQVVSRLTVGTGSRSSTRLRGFLSGTASYSFKLILRDREGLTWSNVVPNAAAAAIFWWLPDYAFIDAARVRISAQVGRRTRGTASLPAVIRPAPSISPR